jgi:hypothetical protein
MAAISIDGFEGYMSLNYGFTSEMIVHFTIDLIKKYLEQGITKKIIIVCDNARAHSKI